MKYIDYLTGEHAAHMAMYESLPSLFAQISEVGILLQQCIKNGGKILLCGNGGSAADSQHIAAEIVGRFKKERKGLPAIALTTDTSILTSVGNDYGYDYIFASELSVGLPQRGPGHCDRARFGPVQPARHHLDQWCVRRVDDLGHSVRRPDRSRAPGAPRRRVVCTPHLPRG